MKTILLGQILFYLHLLKTANITAMSILDKIKSFFSSETNFQDPALEEYETLNTKNEIPVLGQTPSKATVFDESPVMLPIDSEAKVEWPSWLENDDLLRDEGVLFGLSDSKTIRKSPCPSRSQKLRRRPEWTRKNPPGRSLFHRRHHPAGEYPLR